MNIQDVLIEKEAQLKAGETVLFTAADLEILSDPTELGSLKLLVRNIKAFEPSEDITQCLESILRGDSLLRILEYCFFTNRLLHNVTPPWRGFSYGK